MAAIRTSFKSRSFVYDFAADGGAQGSINMGLFIPNNAVIHYGFAKVITTLTSGGAATIAVGASAGLSGTGALIAATAVASWTAGTILEGVDLIVAMEEATAFVQLQATIATADLTAGRFIYTVVYTEMSE